MKTEQQLIAEAYVGEARGSKTADGHESDDQRLDRLVNSPVPATRLSAAQHQFATAKHLDKLVNDHSPRVRAAVMLHRNATPKHLELGLNDEDADVRSKAMDAAYERGHKITLTKH